MHAASKQIEEKCQVYHRIVAKFWEPSEDGQWVVYERAVYSAQLQGWTFP